MHEADDGKLEEVVVINAVVATVPHVGVWMRREDAMRYEDEEGSISAQAVKKCGWDVWFAGTRFSGEETGGKEGPYSVR
jgi:hypothetical protein